MGSRGFAYGSLHKCLRELGMDNKISKLIVREMSKMALRCSYAIYLSRKKIDFQKWQMNEPYHFGNTRDATIESRESRGKEKVVNTPNVESNSKYRKKYQMEMHSKNSLY